MKSNSSLWITSFSSNSSKTCSSFSRSTIFYSIVEMRPSLFIFFFFLSLFAAFWRSSSFFEAILSLRLPGLLLPASDPFSSLFFSLFLLFDFLPHFYLIDYVRDNVFNSPFFSLLTKFIKEPFLLNLLFRFSIFSKEEP